MAALLLGIALTLAVRGYQFGGGNHNVYLIQPLRELDSQLLRNDWWVTHTLQYHVLYTKISALLLRAGLIEPAFMALYLALAVLLHLGWLRLATDLGLCARHYLLSVLLYYFSGGGAGLGMYQFLQDSALLPGNIANVAMLWGIRQWIAGRPLRSSLYLALAAAFHLNHALVAIGLWLSFGAWERISAPATLPRGPSRPKLIWIIGLAAIAIASLPTILPAAQLAFSNRPRLGLDEFVDLYVRLRHPHHYDPLSWPIALWISFLWPVPLAILAWRARSPDPAGSRSAAVFLLYSVLLLAAFVFAGIWFISEPLIQMSLFRFSIYPKLLASLGAAAFILDSRWRRTLPLLPIGVAAAIVAALIASPASPAIVFIRANLDPLLLCALLSVCILLALGPSTPRLAQGSIVLLAVSALLLARARGVWGIALPMDRRDDHGYLAACRWARDHTPLDAVFLVPPDEQLFRYHARRAIVVNFKCVPQLSSEIGQWKTRLEAVLDLPLDSLPRRFDLAHAAIARRYDELPFSHLEAVARRFNASYLLTRRQLPVRQPVFENDSIHLYDLRAQQ